MLLQNRTFPFPFKRLYLCVLLVTLSYSSCSEPIKINKVDHFKKSLLNLLQHCFSYFNVLVFWLWGIWGLSSLNSVGSWILNHLATREAPLLCFWSLLLFTSVPPVSWVPLLPFSTLCSLYPLTLLTGESSLFFLVYICAHQMKLNSRLPVGQM